MSSTSLAMGLKDITARTTRQTNWATAIWVKPTFPFARSALAAQLAMDKCCKSVKFTIEFKQKTAFSAVLGPFVMAPPVLLAHRKRHILLMRVVAGKYQHATPTTSCLLISCLVCPALLLKLDLQ